MMTTLTTMTISESEDEINPEDDRNLGFYS
jgi:hypothetical protein